MFIKNFLLYSLLLSLCSFVHILFAPFPGNADAQQNGAEQIVFVSSSSECLYIPRISSIDNGQDPDRTMIIWEDEQPTTHGQEIQYFQQEPRETNVLAQVSHVVASTDVTLQKDIKIFPDILPALYNEGLIEILKDMLTKNPIVWDRQKMNRILSQKFLRHHQTNGSLRVLLKAILDNNLAIFIKEIENSNGFFGYHGRYSLIYSSILLLPLFVQTKDEWLNVLCWIKRIFLNTGSGSCNSQKHCCCYLVNLSLHEQNLTALSLLAEYPELGTVFECYVERVHNLQYNVSNNNVATPPVDNQVPQDCASFVSLPPTIQNVGMINATSIAIDTHYLLRDLHTYYYESLLEILNHLYRYFYGSKPYDLLHYLDYYIESQSSSKLFLESLRNKLVQKYCDSTGSIRISNETVNIEELVHEVHGYNFEIYQIVQDIKSCRWNLHNMLIFLDNAMMCCSVPQTRQFLQTIRGRLVRKYFALNNTQD